MERIGGGGAGDAASGLSGGRSAATPVAWVVAPAVVARTHGSGRPRVHRPTLLRGSAAVCRLDEGRANGGESCRDQGERNAPRPVTEERCRGQKSPQVERREARRPASSAGDPWRSMDRPDRKAGHRVRRSAPAPVGALPPSHGEGPEKEGVPGASKKYGQRSVGYLTSP